MDEFTRYIGIAYKALLSNKVRTLLTTLGIVIGSAMMVIVFSMGHATEGMITSQIDAYGANTIVVEVKPPGISDTSPAAATSMVEGVTITTLKESDMEAIFEIPGVTNGYSAIIGLERAVSLYDDQEYMIQATSASFIDIDQGEVEIGRYFTHDEDQGLSRVAVLGYDVADELFPDINPIGQSVRIGEVNFKVIGVMEELGVVFMQDMDSQIYVPLNTMQKFVMGIDYVPYMLIQSETDEMAPLIKEDIITLLDQRHNIADENKRDFRVTTMEEAAEIMSVVTGALSLLLLVLAAISLVVGGVGVMNVMFVVVTERTREIGLRKAVGATSKAILTQFLIESIMVTVVGGLIGVLAGLGFVWLAVIGAQAGGIEIEFFIPVGGIVLALCAAVVEGIAFGVYPARKAASLNAIESLRFE